MRPFVGPDGTLYFIDYIDSANELYSLQPTLVALNQDGSLQWQRKLPGIDMTANTNSLYVTETGDIVVIYSSATAGGFGTRCFFISRYSNYGDLLATAPIHASGFGNYGCWAPQIIWANNNDIIWYDGDETQLISGTTLPSGVYTHIDNTWTTTCPYTTIIGYSASTKIQDGNTLYILEGQLNPYQIGSPARFIELDLTTHAVTGHTPDVNIRPSNAPFNSNMYLLHYQDGKFYYNNSLMYDAQTMMTTVLQDPWSDDNTDYTTPRKVTLLTTTDNDNEVWLYWVKSNSEGSRYIIGGKDWYSDNYCWPGGYFGGYPVIYQVWADGGLLLDTSDGLIRLETNLAPVVPPVTPPVTPPTNDEPTTPWTPDSPTTPEPVEPEPVEPEPVEPEPAEPEIPVIPPFILTPETKPEPVITIPNVPTPTPRVIEYTEPTPEIKGTVRGTVILSNGKPLANTRLELHSKPLSTVTNSKGEYIFRGVPLGTHKLYIADIKVSDKKILLQNLTIDNEGRVSSIPVSRVNANKITQTAEVALTAEKPEQVVNMVVDYQLLQEPNKPKWYWFLPLLLLPIIFRRLKKQQHNI